MDTENNKLANQVSAGITALDAEIKRSGKYTDDVLSQVNGKGASQQKSTVSPFANLKGA